MSPLHTAAETLKLKCPPCLADALPMQNLLELAEKTLSIKRNGLVKTSDLTDTNIYFVESGSLRIYVADGEQEQIIRFGYAGDMVVALDSFLSGKPSDFYIQAIKKTVLKVIPGNRFRDLLEQSPDMRFQWQRILEDLVLQQIEREKDILTTSPKERYLRVLRRSPRLFQEIPERYIANYLRMSPETLSRLKKTLT